MSEQKSPLSRRTFLTTSAAGLVSAGLVGLNPVRVLAQESAPVTAKKGQMIYRTLGRTALKMPVISQGVGACNDPGVVEAAYEAGMRHFDTAASYGTGSNEQMVGNVIKRLGVRDKVVIATKIATPAQRRGLSAETAKKRLMLQVNGSLRRLRSDYVDILYVHDVRDPETPVDPVLMEGMRYLKEQGKAKAIGISTHARMADVINATREAGMWDAVLTSFNFTMATDRALLKAIDDAGKAGLGFVAMKALAGGGGWPNPATRQQYTRDVYIPAMLKWVLHNKYVATVIPGFGNHEDMRMDFQVASKPDLTEQEEQFLSDNSIQLGMEFCRQCQQCLASCPQGVDVPNLMRTHMYAAQYSDFALARRTLDDIPISAGIHACVSCDDCTAACANSVNIGRKISELKLMYT